MSMLAMGFVQCMDGTPVPPNVLHVKHSFEHEEGCFIFFDFVANAMRATDGNKEEKNTTEEDKGEIQQIGKQKADRMRQNRGTNRQKSNTRTTSSKTS